MKKVVPLTYYLLFFISLFVTLGSIKKEVSYILIPFYLLILIVQLIFQKKNISVAAFFIVNLTALFAFTHALMAVLYKVFPVPKKDFPLQTILEWQLVLSFIISMLISILFYKKHKETSTRKTNIFVLSVIVLILIIDLL